jgi:5-methylcytosine-specific restriction enzyme A
MPSKPKRICSKSGCNELTDQAYCDKHMRQYDKNRGSSSERGYDNQWRKYRAMFLRDHPLCEICLKDENVSIATVVDHIIPHKGDKKLFWNESNHQALCKECHDRKTATEDGGFGH